jgi:hypothetical protein
LEFHQVCPEIGTDFANIFEGFCVLLLLDLGKTYDGYVNFKSRRRGLIIYITAQSAAF